MGVRRDKSRNKWIAEIYRDGKRIRRWFETRTTALSFFNAERSKKETPEIKVFSYFNVEPPKSKISFPPLSHYAQQWFDLHGQTLSDGVARLRKLKNACYFLGDPPANEFTALMFAEYRRNRLAGKFSENKNKPPKEATVNREHSYFRAMFNELKALKVWDGENPLEGVRLFREHETQLAFLYDDEIHRLLVECDNSLNPDLGLITRICLATGARWSEAETLTQAQVIPYKITFTHTKSKKNRTVPISKELFDMLPKKRGRLFRNSYKAFESAVERAELDLPAGQLTHILRHTFASHFMMKGGNILVLKEILGHSTIEMTMRYAHFAPSHLESAVKLNPLANM